MAKSTIYAALLPLLALYAATSLADDVLRSADGNERVYARDRGDDSQALVDSSGKVVGYRERDSDGNWRYSNRDRSERAYTRDLGGDREALVDDEGKVIGYRKQTDSDEWRYTAPDGTFLGTEESED